MLGAGFRRGANAGFRTGRILLSRRAAQQQQRSMAMGVCLAHKVSFCNVAGLKSVFGQGKFKLKILFELCYSFKVQAVN